MGDFVERVYLRCHAARRGLASNLYRLGVPEIVI